MKNNYTYEEVTYGIVVAPDLSFAIANMEEHKIIAGGFKDRADAGLWFTNNYPNVLLNINTSVFI